MLAFVFEIANCIFVIIRFLVIQIIELIECLLVVVFLILFFFVSSQEGSKRRNCILIDL